MNIKSIMLPLALTFLASCSQNKSANKVCIESAKNFTDSVSIAVGTRLGMVALYDVMQNVPEGVDKGEMWRGAMTVMDADTANLSYIYGIAMGEMLMKNYLMLASRTDINKPLFLNAVKGIFLQDSLPSDEELQSAVANYNLIYEKIESNEKAAADAKIYASEEAAQNRMLNEAVETKLKADSAYQPIGNAGILANVTVPGDSVPLASGKYVVMDIALSRIDSGSEIADKKDMMVPVDNCYDPLISSLLPYLSVGETATFYVPYLLAYGVQGYPNLAIGPCESVIATITVKSVK